MAEAEICGFLDVKFCGSKSKVHRVKRRTLGPWKTWKRHWCSFEKLSSGEGLRMNLDYCISNDNSTSSNDKENFIVIPSDVVVCRAQSRSKQFAFGIFPIKERKPLLYLAGNSETESQRWMTNIRQLLKPRILKFEPGSYKVSIVDNLHSKASGLTGLYGDLTTNTSGVVIKDIHSGEILENFKWYELNQFHLVTAGRPDDVKCICVIHTTEEFRAGIGELHLFCLEAGELLQDLVTQGRGPKHKQIKTRPHSLSEGDIRVCRDKRPRWFSVTTEKMKLKGEPNEKYEEIGCRTSNKMNEDVYQPEPYSHHHTRSHSDISVTSGIYEEIPDELEKNAIATSSFYMEHFLRDRSEKPPPLPPRQRCASESMKGSRCRLENVQSFGPTSSPLSTSPENSVQIERNNSEFQRITDESSYVPMSPRLKDITLVEMQAALQENDYVFMR
ncbi:hypothetical protein E2986_03486 [Frieseomelitta varia]|uniref:PH domain-containing protein n=1 Tax=Frieseomelitta varia TaxID=561572 RepID=A0A833RKH5_9HYME|nr:uncharacterized protein LOC122531243 [Frieseomelitta varia]XP_043514947.1 uncharacterized protein LOC122531243 [Frieseomelitta varia]KAF3425469.1 hypothetical protein E2986_03486 [Frieseomelitta varia]